jgi:hypothetical protein
MDVLLGSFGCLRRAACAAALYEQLLRHDARRDAVPSALPGVMALAGATELLMPRDTAASHSETAAAELGCHLGLLDVLPCCITRVWFDVPGARAATWVRASRFRTEFPDAVAACKSATRLLLRRNVEPRLAGETAASALCREATAPALPTVFAAHGAQLKHVGGVLISNEDLPALARILTRPGTFRTLDLSEGEDARGLLPFLAACPRITALNLAATDVDDAALAAVAARLSDRLRHLVLNATEVGAAGIAALAAHCGPTLRSLDVSGTYLSQPELMLVATRFPDMRSLVIDRMEGEVLDGNAVTAAAFRHMPRLQHAKLSYLHYQATEAFSAELCGDFVAPPCLTSLALSHGVLPAWPPQLVAVSFALNDCVTDGAVAALAAQCGATLRDVNLSHVGDISFAAVRSLCEQCPRLRSLWAPNMFHPLSYDDCDCIATCDAALSGSLELLDLAGDFVSPDSVVALLFGCAGLQVLIADYGEYAVEGCDAAEWDAVLLAARQRDPAAGALPVASPALRAVSLLNRCGHSAALVVQAIERGAAAAGAPYRPRVGTLPRNSWPTFNVL